MCGIVAGVASQDIIPILIEGLRRLEYRGYDSAGVAVLDEAQAIQRIRAQGKVAALQANLNHQPIMGKIGIAHTRWATHGVPNETNAHPHMVEDRLVLVHNGIIENHQVLKDELLKKGVVFSSDTDSEVAAAWILEYLKTTQDLTLAVHQAAKAFEGAYAICVMDKFHPERVVGIRNGAPLVVGLGDNEQYLASDVLTLQKVAEKFIFLEEGDIAEVTKAAIRIMDRSGQIVERPAYQRQLQYDAVDKGHFRHYMLKEIFEQPEALKNTLEGRLSQHRILEQSFGPKAAEYFDKTERVQIVACGTSYHAGLVASHWLEEFAGIPCKVEIASEFRYRKKVVEPNTLLVTISQSGETADTLASLKSIEGNKHYIGSLCICNVAESSLVRGSNLAFLTHAGPEIGVCSTKAFTTQLVGLLMFALLLARRHGLSAEQEAKYVQALSTLPEKLSAFLALSSDIEKFAKFFSDKKHSLFLGRGIHFPIILEGALKLKEISYIHAEAYPGGELKHGPLALVDKDMPVIVLVPKDNLIDKLKSNIESVRARGGQLILFTDKETGYREHQNTKTQDNVFIFEMPTIDPILSPIAYSIPLQLLAYHVAVLKGTDIDQPRNLAKSVTVE